MTNKQLKELFANLAVSQKETDAQIEGKQVYKLKNFQSLNKKPREKLDKVAKMIGGIGDESR